MAIKFLVSDDDDLIWDVDEHSEPITEQQAQLVALRRISVALTAIAEALNKIGSASRSAGAAAARSAAAAKRPAKRKVAAKGKKVVIINQEIAASPFDIRDYRQVAYTPFPTQQHQDALTEALRAVLPTSPPGSRT